MAGILNAIQISSQGLSVQRTKMNTVAQNMANAETTKTPEGGPYKRRRIAVSAVKADESFSTHLKSAKGSLATTHAGHRSGRNMTISAKSSLSSVEAVESIDKDAEPRIVYDPTHPHADDVGYVEMPDVNVLNEMVDMMAASRSYEANTVAIATAKSMAEDALEI